MLTFQTATVVGAGLMGRRIAGVLAGGGLDVRLTDTRTDVLEPAAAEAREVAGGMVHPVGDLADAVDGADLVIEAIIENLAAKQELFATLDRLNGHAVLATNTSVLPVTQIVAKVENQARTAGTHWWNPPDLIPVVEVVRGAHTAPDTVDRLVGLLEHLGKLPVLVRKDVPGFVGNRLQHALWREAIALVAEGVADAETVDLVVRNTIGLRLGRMGPIENADYVGLDLTLAIHEAVLPGLNTETEPHSLLRELVGNNQLGAKTGSGFLDWPEGRRADVAHALAEHVTRQLAARH